MFLILGPKCKLNCMDLFSSSNSLLTASRSLDGYAFSSAVGSTSEATKKATVRLESDGTVLLFYFRTYQP